MAKTIEHLGTYEQENGDYFEIYEEVTEDGRTRLFSGSPTNNTILEDGNEVFYESSFEKQDALEELVENYR